MMVPEKKDMLGKVEKWTHLNLESGHPIKGSQLKLKNGQVVPQGHSQGMDHFILEPDADFQGIIREVRDQMEFDIFT